MLVSVSLGNNSSNDGEYPLSVVLLERYWKAFKVDHVSMFLRILVFKGIVKATVSSLYNDTIQPYLHLPRWESWGSQDKRCSALSDPLRSVAHIMKRISRVHYFSRTFILEHIIHLLLLH